MVRPDIKLRRSIRLKQKKTFLLRCLRIGVLLPSNFKQGIDRDLLLIQQNRKLNLCLKQKNKELKTNDLKTTDKGKREYVKNYSVSNLTVATNGYATTKINLI